MTAPRLFLNFEKSRPAIPQHAFGSTDTTQLLSLNKVETWAACGSYNPQNHLILSDNLTSFIPRALFVLPKTHRYRRVVMQEQTSSEWQAPPPPEKIEKGDPPQMSEVATLGNVFFEPGRTFEDLRRKPRFIIAAVIMALMVFGYVIGLQMKVGESGMRSFISDQ